MQVLYLYRPTKKTADFNALRGFKPANLVFVQSDHIHLKLLGNQGQHLGKSANISLCMTDFLLDDGGKSRYEYLAKHQF